MVKEVENLIPIIRETYTIISDYQLNRSEENEIKLRLQLTRASREFQKFKPLLQGKCRVYIEALDEQQKFPASDIESAFDSAIHQMHLRAGNKRIVRKDEEIDSQLSWSAEMKLFLDERRKT